MDFPAEIIEIIASYLSVNDQYHGLIVCRNWYQPFCRSLYRHIEFKDRHQLKKWSLCRHKDLVRSIQFGTFEKYHARQQDRVDGITGVIPLYSIRVGVTSNELVDLFTELPLLESVQFDSRLWRYLNTHQLQKAAKSRLSTLPALDHPRQLSFVQSKRGLLMSRLHLRGSHMFKLHKKDMFLNIFRFTPNLDELVIDVDCMRDSKHAMSLSIQDMEALHSSLPRLKSLDLIDSVRFIESSFINNDDDDDSQQPISRLTRLHLSVLVEKYAIHQWLGYFGRKYPMLTELTLALSSPYQIPRQQMALENQEKLALVYFINKLTLLKSLAIDNSMSKLYLADTTISSSNKNLNQLQLGLWGDNTKATNTALQCVTMNPVIIQSISHLCIPVWRSPSSIDFSVLATLHQLTHLELNQKSGQQQQQQRHPGYPIDTILKSCPHLTSLRLNHGQIAASTLIQPHPCLRSIRMDHVEISETGDLFSCLSTACPNLKDIFLWKCKSDRFDLVLPGLNLNRVVLSELKQCQDQLNHLNVIQQKNPNSRLYQSYLKRQTFRPCIRRLKKMKSPHRIYLECQSIDQLMFNGCRI